MQQALLERLVETNLAVAEADATVVGAASATNMIQQAAWHSHTDAAQFPHTHTLDTTRPASAPSTWRPSCHARRGRAPPPRKPRACTSTWAPAKGTPHLLEWQLPHPPRRRRDNFALDLLGGGGVRIRGLLRKRPRIRGNGRFSPGRLRCRNRQSCDGSCPGRCWATRCATCEGESGGRRRGRLPGPPRGGAILGQHLCHRFDDQLCGAKVAPGFTNDHNGAAVRAQVVPACARTRTMKSDATALSRHGPPLALGEQPPAGDSTDNSRLASRRSSRSGIPSNECSRSIGCATPDREPGMGTGPRGARRKGRPAGTGGAAAPLRQFAHAAEPARWRCHTGEALSAAPARP